MTRSNVPKKTRRKVYSNTGHWFKSLENLRKEISKKQKREIEIEDEEIEIEDKEIESKNS